MLPFPVFDYSVTREGRIGDAWCVRCEAWVPWEEEAHLYGAGHDPHIADHVQVYYALRANA